MDRSAVNVADILRRAAAYIERHDWHQGPGHMPHSLADNPPANTVLAIYITAGTDTDLSRATLLYLAAFLAPVDMHDVTDWRIAKDVVCDFNDYRAHTANDVCAALNTAAYLWESEHFYTTK